MSLAMTIFSIIAAWISIAISMTWGVLRIARRHHSLVQETDAVATRWKYLSNTKQALPFCHRAG